MGAYNWLRATVACDDSNFAAVLQVQIGWCCYEEYSIGDELIWMDEETRTKVWSDPEYQGLRTMVEVGSPEWQDFATSAGDDYSCPTNGEQGSVIVFIKGNRFSSVAFVHDKIPYGTIVRGEELEKLRLTLR